MVAFYVRAWVWLRLALLMVDFKRLGSNMTSNWLRIESSEECQIASLDGRYWKE